jgi:Rrf2 family protein
LKISAKSRYALAALTTMAMQENSKECVTVISISEHLSISKIYLEQVFSLLKRAKLVTSIKGAQGGYRLSRPASSITALQALAAMEGSLFEKAGSSAGIQAAYIDKALQSKVWGPLDLAVKETLEKTTLLTLAREAQKEQGGEALMFYI